MSKLDIDILKRYTFPENIRTVYHRGRILVISPENANWIVLEKDQHLAVLKYFMEDNSIEAALANPALDNEDVVFVVTQIEARRFCTKQPRRITEEKRALHLYLTNSCNLACPHCYMYSGRSNGNELSTEDIQAILVAYRDVTGGRRVTLSGGEPTLRADFEDIVEKASNLGLEVNLITNGSLLDSNMIARISRHIKSVQVSIDGFSEESDSTIRGKGHFEKAIKTVDNFLNNGVETSIAITPTLELLRDNIDSFTSFAITMIERYSGKPFRVKFAESLSPGRRIRPTKEENEEYERLVKSIQQDIYGVEYSFIEFVENMSCDMIMDNCMFGEFAIASTGDVFMCPEIGEISPITNVRSSTFEEICALSIRAEALTSVDNLEPCKGCDIRYICGGGCRIKEFPLLARRPSFKRDANTEECTKTCTPETKLRFYDMMLESNEYLYASEDEF